MAEVSGTPGVEYLFHEEATALPDLGGVQTTVGKRNRPKGSEKPGREVAGTVTAAQVREIAEAKMKDLSANDVEAAMQIILGSARSIGIEVKG